MMVIMAENDLLARAGVFRLGVAVILSLLMVIPTFGCAIGKEAGVFVHGTGAWWPTEATDRRATGEVMGGREYVTT